MSQMLKTVTVVKVMLPTTPGFSQPRWFVEVRYPGENVNRIHDDSNYDNEADAMRRAEELRRS